MTKKKILITGLGATAPESDTSAHSILEALRRRYATKEFDPTKTVSEEDMETILEAIRLAPTSRGLQPFQVAQVTDSATMLAVRPPYGY